MKGQYVGLWLLLTVSFTLFFVVSSFGDISVGGIEIQTTGMYASLVPQAKEAESEVVAEEPIETETEVAVENLIAADSTAVAGEGAVVAPIEPKCIVDTLPQRILFVGDSMLEGLSPRLAAYAKHNGHTLNSVIWYGSTTKSWGNTKKMAEYIKQYKPTFIFVSLGGNEMFVRDIKTRHLQQLKNILEQIGDIPYQWIGPPNWKPDTGINELLAENIPADRLFVSKDLTLARAKDKVHPTRVAAYGWFDLIVEWMSENQKYLIKLDKPEVQTAKPNTLVTLAPPK